MTPSELVSSFSISAPMCQRANTQVVPPRIEIMVSSLLHANVLNFHQVCELDDKCEDRDAVLPTAGCGCVVLRINTKVQRTLGSAD